MSKLSGAARMITTGLSLVTATSAMAGMTTVYEGAFTRVTAEEPNRAVAERCVVHGNTSPDNWAGATGHLTLKQDGTTSEVTVVMENGRPNTLFTIWLMLAGKTPAGDSFGGSPLMKTGATALIPTSLLAEAVEIMKNPNSNVANGFTTDENGNGSVTIALDFPIVGGAYPFQRFEGFDASDPAYTRDAPQAVPVAITGRSSGAPFTLRLASHCGDNLHNGLVAGQHEPWFDWLAD